MDQLLNLPSAFLHPGLFRGTSRLVVIGELDCKLRHLALLLLLAVENRAGVAEVRDVADIVLDVDCD